MEELIEQYNLARKWRREMLVAMIVLLAVMAALIAVGFVFGEFLAIFVIFGVLVGALGVLVNVISANTLKKARRIIAEYLSSQGKTEEEINSVLGGAKK